MHSISGIIHIPSSQKKYRSLCSSAFSALTLLVGWQEGHTACKNSEWWGAGVVIWSEVHYCVVSMEFSEGIDVGVEEDFVDIGDIQLPDDDLVQCGSNFVLFVT